MEPRVPPLQAFSHCPAISSGGGRVTLGSGPPPAPLAPPPPRMRGLCHPTPQPPFSLHVSGQRSPESGHCRLQDSRMGPGLLPGQQHPRHPRPTPLAAPHGAEHKFTLSRGPSSRARAQHPATVLTAAPGLHLSTLPRRPGEPSGATTAPPLLQPGPLPAPCSPLDGLLCGLGPRNTHLHPRAWAPDSDIPQGDFHS